jgi:hypothetical protein
MDAAAIIGAVEGVTKKWYQQRKAEEKEASRALRRREAMVRRRRVTIRDAAFEVMRPAYRAASSDGTLPAHARQIFYRARGPVQERAGRALDDQYFTQTLLPDYLSENPETTGTWDVVFDARGHFTEPHTELIVPLGTLDVRKYLRDIKPVEAYLLKAGGAAEVKVRAGGLLPTHGPRHRFGAVLFIEKEGFLPLFKAVHLAERYDIAIMSTKGMSVTAARMLVESLCGADGIPLFVLHDFDKSGFSIVSTLQRDTRRYSFAGEVRVIDLGLRLKDIEEWQLEGEDVVYAKSDPTANLRENGATEDEIAFLCDEGRSTWDRYVGRRVELNAFASADLIASIEAGLKNNGVKKVVPDAPDLEMAFRRAAASAIVRQRVGEIVKQAQEEAGRIELPPSLGRLVKAQLKAHPTRPWDSVVAAVAKRLVKSGSARQGDSAS